MLKRNILKTLILRRNIGAALFCLALLLTTASASFATVKIMCVGDSITAGANQSASWRWPLFQLAWAGYSQIQFVGPYSGGSDPSDSQPNPKDGSVVNGQTFHSLHAAVWGAHSNAIAGGFVPPGTFSGYHPDIAIIHLGTNDGNDDGASQDGNQRYHYSNVQQTYNNYGTIVSNLRAENPNVVILLSLLIPKAGDAALQPSINLGIPAWAAANTTGSSPIIVVDQYTGYDPYRMNQSDGLHPAPDGEDFMAQRYFNALIPYLGTPQATYPNYSVFTNPLYLQGSVGHAFNLPLTTTKAATGITVTGLPAGLSYSAGTISGTPSAATAPAAPPGGTGDLVKPDPITITATDAAGSYSENINIAISAPYPTPGTPAAVPGTIFFDNYDSGGLWGGYYGYDSSLPYFPLNFPNFLFAGNWSGPYRNDDIQIGTCSDTVNNGYCVQAPGNQFWMNYTVSVATTGAYQVNVRESGSYTGFIHMLVDGINVTYTTDIVNQYILPNSGGGNIWISVAAPQNVNLTAGVHTIQVGLDGSGFNVNWMSFTQVGNPPAPVITSAATASGTVGTAFSYQITASNSPTSYGASSLPAGTSVNTTTGVISGTPTTAATYNATVTATNPGGVGSKAVTITISAGGPAAPVITSAGSASGGVGISFSYQITASNTPTGYGASSLPTGTSVNTSTGLISGTPTTAATYNATVTATNAGGTGSKAVTITISAVGGFNVNAVYTTGTPFSTGGLDSYGNAYVSSELGASIAFNSSTITFGAANAPDGYSNETVNLPAGTYTTLNMVGTASGGIGTSQTFVVHYTDGTQSIHTINMSDWTNGSAQAGETKILTMAHSLGSSGALIAGNHYLSGYTLTLTGHSVQSITLPAARGVVMLGFASTGGVSAPVVTSSLTANGTTGTAFSYTITASNSPTSYNATSLPAGLTVSTTTGAISGTPTTQGIYSIPISATNTGEREAQPLVATIGSPVTAYNVNAIYTSGTVFSTGGLDSYGDAYLSSQLGASATYNTSTFTFGAANAVDGWANTTVNLAPGTYTSLDMVGTSSGGIASGQTFTVNYTDGTNQPFTISMKDWSSSSTFTGETKVVTMANCAHSTGTSPAGNHVLHGYTLTLNGHSVKSITLPPHAA